MSGFRQPLGAVFAAGMIACCGCGLSSSPPAAPPKVVSRPAPKIVAEARPKQPQPVAPTKKPQATSTTKKTKRSKPAPKAQVVAEPEAAAGEEPQQQPKPAPATKPSKSPRPAPPKQPDLLTEENYNKIQTGMTRAEVAAVLGPQASSAGSGKAWKLVWRPRGTKGQEISIQFHDGKVTSKQSTMAWAAPADAPPERAPAAEAVVKDDKLQRIIEDLQSRDNKKVRSALRSLKEEPLDEERAPQVSRLIQRHLASKDFGLSSAAEAAIRRWVTKENVPYFLKILSLPVDSRDATDDNREQQPLAVAMLVKLREPQGVAPIAKLLTRFFDRSDAKKALLELGPELAEDEVLKYANHKDFNTATAAREILAEFKTGSGKRLDQYLADLRSQVADKRLWAAQAIGDMPPDAARRKEVALALETMLPDKYGWPAHAAAAALGNWGIRENEPALIEALGHVSPDMRRLAAAALGKFGTKQSLPALQKVASGEKLNPATAEAAKTAIAAINGRK